MTEPVSSHPPVPRRPTTPLPPGRVPIKERQAIDGSPRPRADVRATPAPLNASPVPAKPPEAVPVPSHEPSPASQTDIEPGQRPESLFEQAKTTGAVLLPSKGRFYGDKLPDGMVEVLTMTAREDKILSGIDATNISRIFDMILSRCVRSPISSSEMLVTDRYFIMLALRARALGPDYEFPFNCPLCEEPKTQLAKVPIPTAFRLDEGTATGEPFFCKLPDSGKMVGMKFLRGKDDVEIEKFRNAAPKSDEPGDPAFSFIAAKQIISVDDKPFPDTETAMEWYESLSLRDSREIRRTANRATPGVVNLVKVHCRDCKGEPQVRVPLPAELFFAG